MPDTATAHLNVEPQSKMDPKSTTSKTGGVLAHTGCYLKGGGVLTPVRLLKLLLAPQATNDAAAPALSLHSS